jgi:hypothetical protein
MLFFKKARKLTGVHFIILVENNIKPLELYSKQFLGNLARDSIWEQTNLYIAGNCLCWKTKNINLMRFIVCKI